MSPNDPLPLIGNIKRNSHEDGPGIRSVVFFKGCPLRCAFCQNPELQDPGAEIAFSDRECIRCGRCLAACSREAIQFELPGRIQRDRCDRCGRCAEACPGNGLQRIGSYYTVEALAEVLLRDLAFYRHSGGGVTLSGGECTLYPDYLESLLESLKGKAVPVAVQTSGYFNYDTFRRKILPHLDLVYYDIKIMDPEIHRRWIGRSNERIVANLFRLLREKEVPVHPRIPLVPGMTATDENLRAVVNLLIDAGAKRVSLLPYNPMGLGMWEKLGKPRPDVPEGFMKPDQERATYLRFREVISSSVMRSV